MPSSPMHGSGQRRMRRSIVVPSLKELDAVALNEVDQAMFSGDPPRPRSCQLMFQRFGFTHPDKWFTQGGLDQIHHPEADFAVVPDPEAKVLAELRMKYGC